MTDRVTYDEGSTNIDELVLSNASVHLEQMDDTYYMLILENAEHHWHLRIGSKTGRAAVHALMYEDSDDECPRGR